MTDYERLSLHFAHPSLADLLAPVADLLEDRHLVICGATGFVGTWLLAACHRLDAQGVHLRVTALARTLPSSLEKRAAFPGLRWVAADVTRLAIREPAAFMIHAALSSDAPSASEAVHIMQVSVDGTASVLGEAGRHGAKMLYVSSGAVYGDSVDGSPHREDCFYPIDPREPKALYIEAKRAAEAMCSAASCAGQPVVIARLFSALGAGYRSHSHLAAVSLIEDGLSGRPIQIRGDGQARRGFLYGAEVAAWLLRLVVKGEPGDAVNIGNDKAVTIRQLAETIARECHRTADAVVVEGIQCDVTRRDYVPDIDHARSKYGLTPRLSIEEAVHLTCTSWEAR